MSVDRALDALSAGRPIVLGATLVMAATVEAVVPVARLTSGSLRFVVDENEPGVRLMRLAGLPPAAVVAELAVEDARRLAERHELEYVDPRTTVLRLADAVLPTRHGSFRSVAFATLEHPDRHHLALVHGDVAADAPVVRVHAACPAGERFGALVCDCAARLRDAMREIAAGEAGVLVYLRGDESTLVTGLGACVRESGSADAETAAAILRTLRVRSHQTEPV